MNRPPLFWLLFAIAAGDSQTFSIGDGSNLACNGLNKHNCQESDASYTSCDCNQCPTATGCDNFHFYDPAWSAVYSAAQAQGQLYNVEAFKTAAFARYEDSRQNNPKFVFGPIQFVFHYFTPCLFALIFPNGTDGKPTKEIEHTWIGVTEQANGQRVGNDGGGHIPNNWYPRNTSLDGNAISQCILDIYTTHPVMLGANVNGQFVPDTTQLPSAPTKKDILCFIYNAIFGITPPQYLAVVASYLNPVFVGGSWGCLPFNSVG